MDKFGDRGRKRIGIAKRSVFELSTLYLKLSVGRPSILSKIRAIVYVIIHSFPRIIQIRGCTGDI